jgi:hypothetical protein
MHLSKFLHTKIGRYLMSVILGFGLATLFRVVCKDKNCIIKHAPPTDEIDGKTYKFNDKCYTYSSSTKKCDAKLETIGTK